MSKTKLEISQTELVVRKVGCYGLRPIKTEPEPTLEKKPNMLRKINKSFSQKTKKFTGLLHCSPFSFITSGKSAAVRKVGSHELRRTVKTETEPTLEEKPTILQTPKRSFRRENTNVTSSLHFEVRLVEASKATARSIKVKSEFQAR